MSATIRVECPQCGKQTQVPASAVGRTAKCGRCQHRFVIAAPPVLEEAGDDGLMPLEPEPADGLAAGLTPLESAAAGELDEYALRPAEIAPAGPAVAHHAVEVRNPRHAVAPDATSSLGPSRGRAVLDEVARQKHVEKWDAAQIWTMALILGGTALLLGASFLGVLIWWLLPGGQPNAWPPPAVAAPAGGGAGPAVGPAAGGGVAADDTADGADAPVSRQPDPQKQYWVPASPLPAAVNWRVTPEDASPAPAGLRSAIPLADGWPVAWAMAAPQAASLSTIRYLKNPQATSYDDDTLLEWIRYDLKTGQAIGRIPTSAVRQDNDWAYTIAVSPSGKHLAAGYPTAPGGVEVWADDGRKVAQVAVPGVTMQEKIRRVFLASETRLLVDVAGTITGYDLPSGQQVFQLPVPLTPSPVLSRGRRWLVGSTGSGLAWFSTQDGSTAGMIALGEATFDVMRPELRYLDVGVAFHPGGKSAAVIAWSKPLVELPAELIVAVYDLATGAVSEQFAVPVYNDPPFPAAAWCGERQLMFASGQVLDLDLRTWLGRYDGDFMYSQRFVGASPDGRFWRLANIKPEQDAELIALGLPQDGPRNMFLASTVPDGLLQERRREAADLLVWGPDFSVAVSADQSLEGKRRGPMLSALADVLAARGFRVDPQAKFRVEIVNVRRMSGPDVTRGMKPVYGGQLELELRDAQGRTVMPLGRGYGVKGEGDFDDCWKALAKVIETMPPLLPTWRDKNNQLWTSAYDKHPLPIDPQPIPMK